MLTLCSKYLLSSNHPCTILAYAKKKKTTCKFRCKILLILKL